MCCRFLDADGTLLCEVLSREDVRVDSEQAVFGAILRWSSANAGEDAESQRQALPMFEAMIALVRCVLLCVYFDSTVTDVCPPLRSFPLLSQSYLYGVVQGCELYARSELLRLRVASAYRAAQSTELQRMLLYTGPADDLKAEQRLTLSVTKRVSGSEEQ